MSWTEIHVGKWEHLLSNVIGAAGLRQAFRHPYVYRGQGSSAWGLQPSLCRHFDKAADRNLALEVERRLGTDFTARAHLHLSAYLSLQLVNHCDKWALMQHYGAPTRLLDWTTSPYVAAYFACVSQERESGAVWAVHIAALNEQYVARGGKAVSGSEDVGPEFFTPDSPANICAVAQSVYSDRLAAQQGTFTVCTDPTADHAQVIDAALAPLGMVNSCVKFVISPSLKVEILRQLAAMNISSASLFPGLEGLGKSLHDVAKLAAAFGV